MLINCAAYEHGRKIADFPVEQIGQYTDRPDCFVWVALEDPSPGELDEVRRAFALHPLAVEDARHGHQRPKVEEYGDSLFAVMHLLDPQELTSEVLEVGELDVFVGRAYVVSARMRHAHGFTEVRERCEREPELMRNGPGFVLYALMDAVVDRYFPVIDALEVELETIEQRIFTEGAPRARTSAGCTSSSAASRCSSMRSRRCWRRPTSCTADGYRSCAATRRTTTATCSITWRASTARSMPVATRSAPRSRSISRW